MFENEKFSIKEDYKYGETVLILSESDDDSTVDVIQWILYYGVKIVRINVEEPLFIEAMQLSEFTNNIDIIVAKRRIKLTSFASFWYRRGDFSLMINDFKLENGIKAVEKKMKLNILEERNSYKNYLHHVLTKKNSVGNFLSDVEVNKLIVLEEARSVGLSIPTTYIVKKKKLLVELILKHKRVITKSLSEGGLFFLNKNFFTSNPTVLIENKNLLKIPNVFPPSLIQVYIEKKIEIRSFYLKGKLFSSAIFSQADKQTEIDFRNYNNEKPNRVVPFKLPDIIQNKVKQLCDNLKINSGSIDMIYSASREFIFLEVNPIGQFFQISYPCNYYLEQEIAKLLSQ